MNVRLAKELRALRLPWVVGLAAPLALVLMAALVGPPEQWPYRTAAVVVADFLRGSVTAAIPIVIGLLAAMTFGSEFHFRTFPLLLSQPVPRRQVWRQKHLVLAGTVATVLLASLLGNLLDSSLTRHRGTWFSTDELAGRIFAGLLALTTVSAAGFWTLVTRSTLGGLAFSGASQLLVALPLLFVLEKVGCSTATVTAVLVVAGLFYAVTFQWLGWKKFARWELADAAGGGEGSGGLESPRWLRFRWPGLGCQPRGVVRNLVRKELRLVRSLSVLAGLFAVVWLVVLGLLCLAQDSRPNYVETLNVLTGVYVPLMLLLSGCVALGEERSLGIAAWHLTLPIAPAWQWLVKLSTCLLVGAGLGLALPTVLAGLALPVAELGLWSVWFARDGGGPVVLAMAGALVVTGFWAVSVFGTTVRGALTALLTLGGLGLAFGIGMWIAEEARAMLTAPVVHYWLGLTQADLISTREWVLWGLVGSLAAVVAVGLRQSFIGFRSHPLGSWRMARFVGVLVLITCASGYVVRDLNDATVGVSEGFRRSIQRALEKATDWRSKPMQAEFTAGQLEATGELAPSVARWLRGSSISAVQIKGAPLHADQVVKTDLQYVATIKSAHGEMVVHFFVRRPQVGRDGSAPK